MYAWPQDEIASAQICRHHHQVLETVEVCVKSVRRNRRRRKRPVTKGVVMRPILSEEFSGGFDWWIYKSAAFVRGDPSTVDCCVTKSSLWDPLPPSPDVDMFSNYDAVLRDITDRFAPERDVRCRRDLTPTAAPYVATAAAWNVDIDGGHALMQRLQPFLRTVRCCSVVEVKTVPG